MALRQPPKITLAEHNARVRRVREIAARVGFVGREEYRHVYSGTGGAQFGLGRTPAEDLLLVYAEAFDRDANPEDFSLEAILAHERGHQLLFRNPSLQRFYKGNPTAATEEIVASVLGSLIATDPADAQVLIWKAVYDTLKQGVPEAHANRMITNLRQAMEKLL